MAGSVIANFDKTITNDEEEEDSGSGNQRYVARTIPTNTPFFKSSGSTRRLPSERSPSGFEKDTSSSILVTPQARNVRGLPSAAAETPGEFDNGFEDDHEYQDANEYRTEEGPDYGRKDVETHGPDHYGCLEAEPNKDNQDRLWTEIDALDDVKRLARDVNLYEGFPPDFEEGLTKVRASHAHLLKAMRDRNTRIEEERRHEITSKADSHGNSNATLNRHTTGNVGRNTDSKAGGTTNTAAGAIGDRAAGRIDQDYMGATVKADEDKYVQEMIENIKSIRI